MKNNASLVYALFLVVGDFIALVLAFTAAYVLRFKIIDPSIVAPIPARTYAYAILGTLPLWIIVHALIGLYNHGVYSKRFAELGRLLVGSILGMLAVIGYDFFTEAKLFPGRLVPLYGLLIGFGFLLVFRGFARLVRRALFRYGFGVSNVLIVGDTPATDTVVEAIKDTSTSGQEILAIVGRKVGSFNAYASFADATERLRRPIHSIIQTELYRDADKNNEILLYAQQNHVAYRFVPGNSDLFVGNIAVDLFSGLPMVAVHQTALIGWGRIVKRLFDILVSSILIILTSPIMLVVAILESLSGGDVIFRQTRLTRFNQEFTCYKFRTLKHKYNGLLPEEGFALMGKPELAEEFRARGNFLPHDPRLSRLGLFLRKTSLDELPQLFNVLKGDLSLVGPRALVPRELNAFEKKHTILSVKSGLTGLAQISGRNSISVEERRKLDMFYVQNWSFWLDIVILIRTLRVLLVRNEK